MTQSSERAGTRRRTAAGMSAAQALTEKMAGSEDLERMLGGQQHA
jgi:hypothetical protein